MAAAVMHPRAGELFGIFDIDDTMNFEALSRMCYPRRPNNTLPTPNVSEHNPRSAGE
jgi:hypothetical protein